MRRNLIVALGLAAAFFGTSAISGAHPSAKTSPLNGTASSQQAKGKPIILGRPEGETGYLKLYDGPVTQAIRLAIADVNKKGGVLGRPLKLVTADTKTQISLVPTAALDVISKGAQIMLPSWDYDLGAPAARIAVQRGMLAVSGAGSPNYGLRGIGKTFFNTYNASPTEGGTMAEFAYFRAKARHPYILTDTSIEYSKDGCKYLKERWVQLAGKSSIAGEDTFVNSDPTIPAQITRLRNARKADFIFICSYPPGGAAVIKQIRDAGIKLRIMGGGGGFDGSYWVNSIPHLSNFYTNVEGSLYHDDPTPAINKLFDRMQKVQGSRPLASQAIDGYVAIQLIVRAIKKAHSCCDGRKLARVFESFKRVPTMTGLVTFSKTCHISQGRRVRIIKITNGKPKYLETLTPRKVPASPC